MLIKVCLNKAVCQRSMNEPPQRLAPVHKDPGVSRSSEHLPFILYLKHNTQNRNVQFYLVLVFLENSFLQSPTFPVGL